MGSRSGFGGSRKSRVARQRLLPLFCLTLVAAVVFGQTGLLAQAAGPELPGASAGQAVGPNAAAALDSGDVSLDFIAAGPYTYDHGTGVGGAFNDRTISKSNGVVESLEGGDFACGDLVVFFTAITVEPGDGAGAVDLDYTYDGQTTSGSPVGFNDIISASINSPDTGNENLDNNESASIIAEQFVTQGKDRLETTIRVEGVDGGDQIILRMVVRLACALNPGNITGNIQSTLDHAEVVGGQTINSGEQTIPLKQAGDILIPGLNVQKSCPATGSVGDTITYTITVTNDGQDTLNGLTVQDSILGDLSGAFPDTLTAGQVVTEEFDHVLSSTPDPITNVVTVSATANQTSTVVSDTADCTTDVLFPGLEIDKTPDQGTVSAGQDIGFTVTVTNDGPGTAKDVILTDTLPTDAGLNWSFNQVSGGWTCGIAAGVLTCGGNGFNLASGASASVHLTSPTTRLSCGTVDNTGVADASNAPQVSDPASVTVQCPDLEVTKTADASPVSAGDPIGYTITVRNDGPGTAFGVVLSDTLSTNAGLNWSFNQVSGGWTCDIANGVLTCGGPNFNLANGATASVHLTSPTTSATCGQVANQASVSASNNVTVTSDIAYIVVDCAALNVTKIADDGVVNAGDDIGYLITVTNGGAGVARNVTLTDTLPSNAGLSWTIDGGTGAGSCQIANGVLSCSFGDLASGASRTVHISSPTTPASCGVVSNTVFVTSSNDGNPSAGPVTIVVNCPDVSVLKTADQGTIDAGDLARFTIVVANHGSGTAYDVTLSDTLPSGVAWTEDNADCSIASGVLSCDFGDLAPGASRTVHVSGLTDASDCGELVNTATVDASNESNNANTTDDNSSTATIVVECPDVSVRKTADQGTIDAGDMAAFTIVVSNDGDGEARDVTLVDTLPGGVDWSEDSADCSIAGDVLTCDFGDLASGASRTVHVWGETDAADCGELVNVATVAASNEADDEEDDNASEATITVDCPDVSVLKTADQGTISAGDTAAFTIVVTNHGDGLARNVTLVDQLPAGVDWEQDHDDCDIAAGVLTCDFGDLASGASRTIHVWGETDPADCGELVNVATVAASNEADDDLGDNASEATIEVDCPGIDVEKEADAGTVDAGELIGFSITVTNGGEGIARDVVLTDTLPTNDSLGWSIDGGSGAQACVIDAGVLTCEFGDMGPGASFTVHLSSDTDYRACGTVDNTAVVTIANGDGDEDDASLEVNCPELGIDIQKGGPDLAHVGDTVTYTFDVSLTTAEPLYNVTVTDPNCNEGAPVYQSGDDGDDALEPGEVWTYTCTHLVTEDDPDPLPNLATVTGDSDDGRQVSDEDDHVVDLIHPDIRIRKTVNPVSGEPGDIVTYTYAVTNTGDTTLYDVTVDDDILGHIGVIDQLELGDTVVLTKDWELPSEDVTVVNVGTATGTDILGEDVSDTDDADVTIVLAEEPPPTAFTGGEAMRYGTFAAVLLVLGAIALAVASRRRKEA